jgi:uncharacterized peroxidase-related enzyme
VSFIATVDEAAATGETARLYAQERERVGYLPNYTRVFGQRPSVYAAWRQLGAAVSSAMDSRRYELVTMAAAKQLRSTYCSVAHGVVLAEKFLSTDDIVALARGESSAAFDETDLAVMSFAAKVARMPADVTAEDVQQLRDLGLDDTEILDVILATAARCFFSTVLEATGTQTDSAFRQKLAPDIIDALTVGRPVAD